MKMDVILVLMAFLLQGLQEAKAIEVTGEEGKEVKFTCVHSNAASNVKYFCSRQCRDEDIEVTSKRPDKKGKFSIIDKGNTFSVTVSKLTVEDSGTYWCGIERVGVDTYTRVDIKVTKKSEVKHGNNHLENALTSKELYIGTGLGVVVLALAVALLIFFRHRKKHISPSQEKGQQMVKATPSTQRQDRHLGGVTPSTGKKHGAFSSSNSTTDLHSDISSEPQTQQEALFYSTVSFNKHADCSGAPPPDPVTTYTTIELRSTDESAVYSNV